MERLLPIRAMLRNEIELPKDMKSRIEQDEPNAPSPYKDREEP
jgi:hypothetical protein